MGMWLKSKITEKYYIIMVLVKAEHYQIAAKKTISDGA